MAFFDTDLLNKMHLYGKIEIAISYRENICHIVVTCCMLNTPAASIRQARAKRDLQVFFERAYYAHLLATPCRPGVTASDVVTIGRRVISRLSFTRAATRFKEAPPVIASMRLSRYTRRGFRSIGRRQSGAAARLS